MDKDNEEIGGIFTEGRATAFIAECGSKIVAALTVILSATAIFADVSFASFGTTSFTSTLFVLLAATYLMYFSLSDVGERAGEACEEAQAIYAEYELTKAKILPDKIGELREFLTEYSREELAFRKRTILASGGLSEEDLLSFIKGKKFTREERRILKRARRQRAAELTPATLLSGERGRTKSELENPERHKYGGFILRLLPTTVCMLFTVSLALTAKDGLTVSAVLDGIFKLSSLPLSGLRGYRAGYIYARHTRSAWCEVKTRILKAFLKRSEPT